MFGCSAMPILPGKPMVVIASPGIPEGVSRQNFVVPVVHGFFSREISVSAVDMGTLGDVRGTFEPAFTEQLLADAVAFVVGDDPVRNCSLHDLLSAQLNRR